MRMVLPIPVIRPSTVAAYESRSNAILRPARAPRRVPYIHPATAATMWSSVDATGGPSFDAVPTAPAGGGVQGWGRDGLGTGVRGRGARTRRALMSTTRSGIDLRGWDTTLPTIAPRTLISCIPNRPLVAAKCNRSAEIRDGTYSAKSKRDSKSHRGVTVA